VTKKIKCIEDPFSRVSLKLGPYGTGIRIMKYFCNFKVRSGRESDFPGDRKFTAEKPRAKTWRGGRYFGVRYGTLY
jgi:hypothetical protein